MFNRRASCGPVAIVATACPSREDRSTILRQIRLGTSTVRRFEAEWIGKEVVTLHRQRIGGDASTSSLSLCRGYHAPGLSLRERPESETERESP